MTASLGVLLATTFSTTGFISPDYVLRQLELVELTQQAVAEEVECAKAYAAFANTRPENLATPIDFIQLARAEAQLAAARAGLARALGEVELAKPELRKVLAYREMVVDVVAARIHCHHREETVEAAHAGVAEVRVQLAELEGDRQTILKNVPRVIASYRVRIERADHLLRLRVIPQDEAANVRHRSSRKIAQLESVLARWR